MVRPVRVTLCGGSCRNCPEAELDADRRVVTLQEFGQKISIDETQLQMLVQLARDNGFDV